MSNAIKFLLLWVATHLFIGMFYSLNVSIIYPFGLMPIAIALPLIAWLFGFAEAFMLRRVLGWKMDSWAASSFRGGIVGVVLLWFVIMFMYHVPSQVFYPVFSFGLCLGQLWAFPSAKQRWIWLLVNFLLLILQIGGSAFFYFLLPPRMVSLAFGLQSDVIRLLSLIIQVVVLLDLQKINPAPVAENTTVRQPRFILFMVLWIILSVIMFFPWMGFMYAGFPNLWPFIIIPIVSLVIPWLQGFIAKRYLVWPLRWWTELSLFASVLGLFAAFWIEVMLSGWQIGRYMDERLALALFCSAYPAYRLILALIQAISMRNWRKGGLWLFSNYFGAVAIWVVMMFQWNQYPFHAMNWLGFVIQILTAGVNACALIYFAND